jgi:hypothetical protein
MALTQVPCQSTSARRESPASFLVRLEAQGLFPAIAMLIPMNYERSRDARVSDLHDLSSRTSPLNLRNLRETQRDAHGEPVASLFIAACLARSRRAPSRPNRLR